MKSSKLDLQIMVGRSGLKNSRSVWQKLFIKSGCKNPFLTWEWNYAWASKYALDKDIKILVVELEGQAIGIAPLLISKQIRFLIDPIYADYADFLVLTEHADLALKKLLEYILNQRILIVFGPLQGSSLTVRYITQIVENMGKLMSVETISNNPRVLPLTEFQSYMITRSRKLKQELRTTINHLAKGGDWEFVEYGEGGQDVELLSSLFKFHCGRQKSKLGNSIFSSSENKEFFSNLVDVLSAGPAQAHLSAIIWQKRYISVVYSLICGATFYYWIPSFDQSIKGVSIGKLHLKCLIEKCFKEDMVFDFMGGGEVYKTQWANDSYENVMIYIYTSSLQKTKHLCIKLAINYLKRIKKSTPILEKIWMLITKIY